MASVAWTMLGGAEDAFEVWREFRRQVDPRTAAEVLTKIQRHAVRAALSDFACKRHGLRVLRVIAEKGYYGGLYVRQMSEAHEVREIVKFFAGSQPSSADIEISCSRVEGRLGA